MSYETIILAIIAVTAGFLSGVAACAVILYLTARKYGR